MPSPNWPGRPLAWAASATDSAAARASAGSGASNRATTAASWLLHRYGAGRRDSRSWTSSRSASTAGSDRSPSARLATSTAIAGEAPSPRKRSRRRISEADSSPSSRASRKSPTSRRSVLATAWALASSRPTAVARWWTTTWWNGSGRPPRCSTRNPAGPPPTSTGSRLRLPPSSERLSENSLPSGRRAWISAQTALGGSTAAAPLAQHPRQGLLDRPGPLEEHVLLADQALEQRLGDGDEGHFEGDLEDR